MSTPHNQANPGDIASTVLMPGDPMRAKFIAEHYLENPVCFNQVRGMLGYTGTVQGIKISVMGSGMGIPSMGIYSHELYHEYGVENIIRVGTCGGISPKVRLLDVVIGLGSCTDSGYGKQFGLTGTFAPTADYSLLEAAVTAARRKGARFHVGNLFSSDIFYEGDEDVLKNYARMGVLAVEMESAGLYMNAAEAGKAALCIATVSDCPLEGQSTSSGQRETAFTSMMEIALDAAISMEKQR